jgi:hypothetical protein
MNTQELQDHLRSGPLTRRGTVGVYPAEKLSSRMTKFPAVVIANSDTSTDTLYPPFYVQSGAHWCSPVCHVHPYLREIKCENYKLFVYLPIIFITNAASSLQK